MEEGYRPRIIQQGLGALTDAELLDLLLSHPPTDASLAALRRLLKWAGSLQGLARRDWVEIIRQEGMGERKALQILAAFEIGRRATRHDTRQLNFSRADQVAAHLQAMLRDATQEQLVVLSLDRAGQLLSERVVFVGGVSSTIVDPKVVFQIVLAAQASAFIVCHNHPSGNYAPSEHDFAITNLLMKGARLLELQMLDHIIVSYKGYYSFAEQGMLPLA